MVRARREERRDDRQLGRPGGGGKRMKNGRKTSAPWTYELDPALVWIPTGEELEQLRSTLDI